MSALRENPITFTIANNGTDSDKLSSILSPAQLAAIGAITDILVFTPATFTGTVTVYVADKPGGTMVPLYVNGANVTLTAAKAIPLPVAAIGDLQFISGSNEGAERLIKVVFQLSIT